MTSAPEWDQEGPAFHPLAGIPSWKRIASWKPGIRMIPSHGSTKSFAFRSPTSKRRLDQRTGSMEDQLAEEQNPFQDCVLMIKTPVTVTLARKKETLSRIVNLVPGAMLTFDAHCDEPLTLEAGDQPIARGETVKIGDKFGLRIRHLISNDDLEE